MNKLLLPYNDVSYTIGSKPSFGRLMINGGSIFSVYQGTDKAWYHVFSLRSIPIAAFDTKENAILALDAILIEEGYEFISEERAEKLRLLL